MLSVSEFNKGRTNEMIDHKLAVTLEYWINWYIKREQDMVRKGYERYLTHSEIKRLEDKLGIDKPEYYPNGQRTKPYVWDKTPIPFKSSK